MKIIQRMLIIGGAWMLTLPGYTEVKIDDEADKLISQTGLSAFYRAWQAEWELPYNLDANIGEELMHSVGLSYSLGEGSFLQVIYTTGSGWDTDELPAFTGGDKDIERTELQIMFGSSVHTGASPLTSTSLAIGYHYIQSTSPGIVEFPRRGELPYMLDTTAHGLDCGVGVSAGITDHIGVFGGAAAGFYLIEAEASGDSSISYDDFTAGYNFEAGIIAQLGNITGKIGYRYWSIIGVFDPSIDEPNIEAEDDILQGAFLEIGGSF